MPSFMLRAIDPVLWLRVQAKAAADGITVKALILKAIAQYVALPLFILLTVACAYHAPDGPTPIPPIAESAPFTLTLGTVSGTVASTTTISARVQNLHGAPLGGIPVAFTTDHGTLSIADAVTTSAGIATTTLTSTTTAMVNASTGLVSARTLVAAQPASTPPPPPTPTPPPSPTPLPPAPPTGVFLNVSSVAALTGAPVTFGVSSSALGLTWVFTFGDGATVSTAAFTTTHAYTSAGRYTATVSGPGTATASATITVTDPAPLPPPPPPTLSLTMNCTSPPARSMTCNVAATYNSVNLPSNSLMTGWDWGDGGTSPASLSPLGSHPYGQAGTYLVVATVTTTTVDGDKTATVSKSIIVP